MMIYANINGWEEEKDGGGGLHSCVSVIFVYVCHLIWSYGSSIIFELNISPDDVPIPRTPLSKHP